VHLGIPALLKFYREHRENDALVLATIIGTNGSTYRKPGAMMLISRDGAFEGMISGGCLESDLLQHAADVFSHGQPRHITYDMHADEDLVWDLGLGCDGVIHLLLQRLDRSNEFGFLKQLDESHSARRVSFLALVTQSAGTPAAGNFALLDEHDISVGPGSLLDILRHSAEVRPKWRAKFERVNFNLETIEIMLIHVPVQTRVLICGAGPDSLPVARILSEMDWDIQLVDHRPAYARHERFPEKCRVTEARPERLSESVELNEIDAAVIMSHHLENDAHFLRQLAGRDIPYIGILGPGARRDRVREMAGCSERSVFGPVGLDIGAELPESIALSIAAEIHAVLNDRNGQPLTLKNGE
jgi:xanthine/CO dehydrogenase XdhC/CoxF family maturation factor